MLMHFTLWYNIAVLLVFVWSCPSEHLTSQWPWHWLRAPFAVLVLNSLLTLDLVTVSLDCWFCSISDNYFLLFLSIWPCLGYSWSGVRGNIARTAPLVRVAVYSCTMSLKQLTGLVYKIWLHVTGFTHCA